MDAAVLHTLGKPPRYEQFPEPIADDGEVIVRVHAASDLDKPTKAPPKGREQEFSTFGRSFLTLALHEMLHRANVTDARRAAGRIALVTRAAV